MPPSHDDDEPLHEKLLRRRILVFFVAAVAEFLLSFAYSGDASFSAPFNIFFFVLLLLTRHGGAQSLSGQVKFLCLPMLCYAATNALLHNLSLLWSWVKGTNIVFRVVIVPSAMINVATFFGYLTGTWPPRGLHQRLGWLRLFAAISSVGVSMLRLQVAVTALIYGIKTPRRRQDNQSGTLRHRPRYRYSSIQRPKDIRLLWLFAGRFDLVTVSLDDKPKYECISYTWGDPEKTHQITIRGLPLPITSNVNDILRAQSSLRWPKLLWIDSICIDQSNLTEKSAQVQLMGEIYRQASRVIVHLGDDPEARLAHGLMKELSHLGKLSFGQLSEKMVGYFTDSRRLPEWLALIRVLDHRWFERIWVVQEVAVASKVDVICGTESIDWTTLSELGGPLGDNLALGVLLRTTGDPTKSRKPPRGFINSKIMDVIKHEIKGSQERTLRDARLPLLPIATDLRAAMLQCRYFQATDPRDRIFALSGICTDCPPSLRPDYTKTTEQVFLSAANYFLSLPNPLRMLPLAGTGFARSLPNLPSWVPDFNSNPITEPITIESYRPTRNRASGDCTARFRVNTPYLHVAGVQVDSLRSVGLHRSNDFGTAPLIDDLAVSALSIACHNEARFLLDFAPDDAPYAACPGQTIAEAYWRTLIGDRTFTERPAPAVYGEYFRLQQNPNVQLDDLAHNLSAKWGGAVAAFGVGESNCAIGRRFCVTAKGFMGMVPPGARVGDLVCIFLGAQVPFLLRMVEAERFELVGEAYFHGMMDGEMMGEEVRDFVLV
jgi:hypothetical protein